MTYEATTEIAALLAKYGTETVLRVIRDGADAVAAHAALHADRKVNSHFQAGAKAIGAAMVAFKVAEAHSDGTVATGVELLPPYEATKH